mgnify:FL=1
MKLHNHAMRYVQAVLAAALLILVGSCGVFGERGSGELATEARNVDVFTGIDLKGIGSVSLVEGPDQSIQVTTDDNLLERLQTEMRGDVLTIYFSQGTREVTSLEITIETPRIESVANSGSGSIRGSGEFLADRLDIDISGSGAVILEVQTQTLDVEVTGSGSAVLRGSAVNFRGDVSGSGSIEAAELSAERAEVDVGGSGRVEIDASRNINVEISGSGTVSYTGAARLNSNVTGSGEVRARGQDSDSGE